MVLVGEVVGALNASGNFQWNANYPTPAHFLNDADNGELWVAEDSGRIVGIVSIVTAPDYEYEAIGWDCSVPCVTPRRLAVSPACQGRGVCQRLMLKAEDIARELRIAVLRADTSESNGVMRHVFDKLGYLHGGKIKLRDEDPIYEHMRFSCYQKTLLLQ